MTAPESSSNGTQIRSNYSRYSEWIVRSLRRAGRRAPSNDILFSTESLLAYAPVPSPADRRDADLRDFLAGFQSKRLFHFMRHPLDEPFIDYRLVSWRDDRGQWHRAVIHTFLLRRDPTDTWLLSFAADVKAPDAIEKHGPTPTRAYPLAFTFICLASEAPAFARWLVKLCTLSVHAPHFKQELPAPAFPLVFHYGDDAFDASYIITEAASDILGPSYPQPGGT